MNTERTQLNVVLSVFDCVVQQVKLDILRTPQLSCRKWILSPNEPFHNVIVIVIYSCDFSCSDLTQEKLKERDVGEGAET